MNFLNIFEIKKKTPSDINEHLDTLFKYSQDCDTIVELGTRGLISTYAFLAAKPKNLYSIDIVRPENWGCNNFNQILEEANKQGIKYVFLQSDSTTASIKEEKIDLLFVDTIHTYTQVKKELKNFSSKVTKYIIFHDTVLYGIDGYGINGLEKNNGILKAINEFLESNKHWKLLEKFENNNGLMVIKNVQA